ncbi:MAG: hypothetical protein DSY92_00230 [Planctomycetota bacterium]|nr:MAG: hypothetical protein DSY92_00230 [Planctomycetota bacterium]
MDSSSEPTRPPSASDLFRDDTPAVELIDEPLAAAVPSEATRATEASKPPWRDPLDALIAAGRADADPGAAIAALLAAQPGMGDQLLALLLESQGGQDEQDALLVALAMALSIDTTQATEQATEAGSGELASLWFDRDGTILAMADLWISGEDRARYFPRFLQMEGVLEPWHAIELASMMESANAAKEMAGQPRTRLLKMIELSLASANQQAVAIAGEWLESSMPELRELAQRTVVSALADDPGSAADWIERADESVQVPLLEAVLYRISGDHLSRFLEETGDTMLQQEYRGSALLSGFSRATDLDLQQLIYQRGESTDSESYRKLVLFGSQGALGRGDSFPPSWAQTLKWVAETDPARSVRGTALRICALSWPAGDTAGFHRLIQTSDVDQRTAEIAASLLSARGSARWSLGD